MDGFSINHLGPPKKMPLSKDTDIQIPFHDVDSMRIAWHGHFAKYFEVARCNLLDEIGHGYQAMFDCGYAWPIVDMRIRYMRALRFSQTIRVTATLKQWDHLLKITYRIRDPETGGSLTRGYTTHAPVDVATGELYFGQPPQVASALAAAGITPPASGEFP